MCEVEPIVNLRPLTVETLDDSSATVLTPNHILTMKPSVVTAPPGNFDDSDEDTRRGWRTVPLFAERFGARGRKECVNTLEVQKKWNGPKRNTGEPLIAATSE